MELNDGTRVFGVIHISYKYEIDCKCVYRTILFALTLHAASQSQSSYYNEQRLQMHLQNVHALFHIYDLWASLLFCIKCYTTETNKMLHVRSQPNDELKGDCGPLQSESLFAAALNQRDTYFLTLSHKTYVNANPLTGQKDAQRSYIWKRACTFCKCICSRCSL